MLLIMLLFGKFGCRIDMDLLANDHITRDCDKSIEVFKFLQIAYNSCLIVADPNANLLNNWHGRNQLTPDVTKG